MNNQLAGLAGQFVASARAIPTVTDVDIVSAVQSLTGSVFTHGLTVSDPDIDGFIRIAEYPGFKFLTNLTLQIFTCTPRQEAIIRGNVSCAHNGTIQAGAFIGFEGSTDGQGYSWMVPIKFAPPEDPSDPLGHWIPMPNEKFDASDGLWPMRLRVIDEAHAVAYLKANPPSRPTEGGNPVGSGYVPQR